MLKSSLLVSSNSWRQSMSSLFFLPKPKPGAHARPVLLSGEFLGNHLSFHPPSLHHNGKKRHMSLFSSTAHTFRALYMIADNSLVRWAEKMPFSPIFKSGIWTRDKTTWINKWWVGPLPLPGCKALFSKSDSVEDGQPSLLSTAVLPLWGPPIILLCLLPSSSHLPLYPNGFHGPTFQS